MVNVGNARDFVASCCSRPRQGKSSETSMKWALLAILHRKKHRFRYPALAVALFPARRRHRRADLAFGPAGQSAAQPLTVDFRTVAGVSSTMARATLSRGSFSEEIDWRSNFLTEHDLSGKSLSPFRIIRNAQRPGRFSFGRLFGSASGRLKTVRCVLGASKGAYKAFSRPSALPTDHHYRHPAPHDRAVRDGAAAADAREIGRASRRNHFGCWGRFGHWDRAGRCRLAPAAVVAAAGCR